MTDQEMEKLLRAQALLSVKMHDCPDEHDLAAFVVGALTVEKRALIQQHLSACDECVRQVGLLVRIGDESYEKPASEFLLARAKRLGKRKSPAMPSEKVGWAAAAVLVLAITLVFDFWPGSPQGEEGETALLRSTQQGRSWNDQVYVPKLLAPVPGGVIGETELNVRWTETPGSLYYELRIVSDDGGVLWSQRTDETVLALPVSLGFQPGREYFIRVDAYLDSARIVSSEHVPFAVKGDVP